MKKTNTPQTWEEIKKCDLFDGINDSEIEALIDAVSGQVQEYSKHSVVALEGEECNKLGIVLRGRVDVRRIHASGKEMTITSLKEGDTFGEVMVFSDYHQYPSSIYTEAGAKILQIPQQEVLLLCKRSDRFLKNLIRLLSNKVWMMNEKLKMLSYQNIKQRIAAYLLEQHSKQGSMKIVLPHNRQEMADFLGMPRPSLSREMAKLKKEGLIEYYKAHVTLKNLEALESIHTD